MICVRIRPARATETSEAVADLPQMSSSSLRHREPKTFPIRPQNAGGFSPLKEAACFHCFGIGFNKSLANTGVCVPVYICVYIYVYIYMYIYICIYIYVYIYVYIYISKNTGY